MSLDENSVLEPVAPEFSGGAGDFDARHHFHRRGGLAFSECFQRHRLAADFSADEPDPCRRGEGKDVLVLELRGVPAGGVSHLPGWPVRPRLSGAQSHQVDRQRLDEHSPAQQDLRHCQAGQPVVFQQQIGLSAGGAGSLPAPGLAHHRLCHRRAKKPGRGKIDQRFHPHHPQPDLRLSPPVAGGRAGQSGHVGRGWD